MNTLWLKFIGNKIHTQGYKLKTSSKLNITNNFDRSVSANTGHRLYLADLQRLFIFLAAN